MRTLDYQAPQCRSTVSAALWFLFVLPIVAGISAFLSAANWVGEPFGVVETVDVILFFGAPVIALGSAIAWCLIARRRRLPWPAFVLVVAWFALMLYWAIDSLLPYFREPWNT